MQVSIRKILSYLQPKLFSAFIIWGFAAPMAAFAQPANDNCASASFIAIANSGFGLGTYTSTQDDMTAATLQTGETFAASINTAGINKKSVWYKFTLPTARGVRISLLQPGSAIQAGDVGFAVYQSNTCLPPGSAISGKLTAIETFGNTYHPCVELGDYYIQVSGNNNANGPVYITVETSPTTAAYDRPAQAYHFGVLPRGTSSHPLFNIGCQSLDDAGEICNTLGNYQNYNKSTWHVFTTPAYLDFLNIVMGGWPTAAFKFGFKIYQGDVRSTPYSGLPTVWGCDSLVTDGYSYANKVIGCNTLNPNTTYSLQLFYDKNYTSQITLDLVLNGLAPTIAPEPILSSIAPTTNNLGVLPASPTGITTTTNDNLACNARHAIHPCEPSLPLSGVVYNGENYKLSSFFMFTLSATSTIQFTTTPAPGVCSSPMLLRLFNQNSSNNCASLDTTNIINKFITSQSISCLPPGNYTVQVMGVDTNIYSKYCPKGSLGTSFILSLTVKTVTASNKYNLSSSGAFDTLNRVSGIMQPLVPGVTYNSKIDTFGCGNTVLPANNCDPAFTKAIYREFIVPDSGMVSLWSSSWSSQHRIYKGDANATAIAQNTFSHPGVLSGLTSQTVCLTEPNPGFVPCDGRKVCVVPGTYTQVTFGYSGIIGTAYQFQTRFNPVTTAHGTPATAEDLGDVLGIIPPGGGNITSTVDYYSCKDNAVAINGFQPCTVDGILATKVIYRQFYLSSPSGLSIESLADGCAGGGQLTLFKGRATDGLAALTVMPAPYRCFTTVGGNACSPLDAGWYTVVSYGTGPSYDQPTRDVNPGFSNYSQFVGYGNKVRITLVLPTCPLPKYNRPHKAAIDNMTGKPYLIQWGPRVGHTDAYPKTDTTYTLSTENFNCKNDTPFISHPIVGCNPSVTKLAYWVFRITQESFVAINTENYWNGAPYAYAAKVYAGNVRTDSALFSTAQPIQPCLFSLGHIQLCKLQPGDYTLVVFATPDAVCKTVTPTIYIDQVGYSRFDHASNAYDFGQIKPDSNWYNGKQNDVNPLAPGRAPSNDFFYCTTGAQVTDPLLGCASAVLPNIYNPGNNNPLFTSNYIGANGYSYPLGVARNLWYTFTVDKGGLVRVRVNNKTMSKGWQYNFIVVKSNVDGTLPFSTVVASGGVDSTAIQGLEVVASNDLGYCDGVTEVSFLREPCTPIPERYYIIVANRVPSNRHNHDAHHPEWMYPNHQVEVQVLFDSANGVLPKFDHHFQSSNIGTNLGPGTYTGVKDNISCATRDASDPVPPCGKTLWYKFSTSVSGVLFPKVFIEGYPDNYFYFIRIYKEITPGDSTSNGLQYIDVLNVGGEYQTCISPGTYYFVIQDCGNSGLTVGNVHPQITFAELAGDYCSRPVISTLTGAGNQTTTATISCHTIGTDYGEFNQTLTCPPNAITKNYKSTWYRLDIAGMDTLDITVFLNENTSVGSADIKYRMMTGNCNAMQEQSCVQDALTRNTYKCLAPGKSYYIQVFSPVSTLGTVELNVSAVKHADSCQPQPPCIAVANFSTQFDCTNDKNVTFINSSTYGISIQYDWNFGYNNQTSTAVVPQFYYPALTTAATYTVRLIVTNTDCGKKDTVNQSITIPARAVLSLGNDTTLCNGGSVILNATSYPGATYQWSTGATSPSIMVSGLGLGFYNVAVTYNGCISRDTVAVNIDPINPVTQYKYVCGTDPVLLNASRGLGESYSWSTGAASASINVFAAGIYWVDVRLRGCTSRDTFIVSKTALTLGNDRPACFGTQSVVLNATTAGATGYTWQNGSTNAIFTAPSAGLYWVDISFANCTLRDSVVLSNLQPQTATINAAICQGQTYTLPSGKIVSATGVYKDTLRTTGGCDSVVNTITLFAQNVIAVTTIAAICPGQSYILPWGVVVNTAGIYRDTLRYNNTGCDSVRRTINLGVQTANANITNTAICAGQTYTLPWGTVVNTAGIYRDTLRYAVTGCDSIRRTVNLAIQTAALNTSNAAICAGESYTLPWGVVVNTGGVYSDTLRYINTGCDSIRRTVNLTLKSFTVTNTNAFICAGQTYTLPWGAVVNTTGVYADTLRYVVSGCDSVRRTVNLVVQSAPSITNNATICAGQTYTLPWGGVVNTTGVYRDTIKYANSGCDSIYHVVSLTVMAVASATTNTTICAGQNYTLPWGVVVNTGGVYSDTLRYINTGCDSVRRIVNLTLKSFTTTNTNAAICAGQIYTLPWGPVVNATGIYADTLRYVVSGCDSARRTVNLVVQSAPSISTNATICAGQTYTLPWGGVVNTTGVFRDTIKYANSGCDSIYHAVNLTVMSVASSTTNASICAGQNYTLPWGAVVNAAGIYGDTLRYSFTGCDSVRRMVNLTVQSPITNNINASICAGQSYTLPSGTVVSAAGVYRDTLYYNSSGCDSVWRTITLFVGIPLSTFIDAAICAGQTYTLPWGTVVNTAGVYRDTLRSVAFGCDSIRRTVSLTIQSAVATSTNATICAGQTYTLPSGNVVSAGGVYSDTLRYTVTGCDSVRRTVNLTMKPVVTLTTIAAICVGQSYNLPWGVNVNIAGVYSDTLRYIVSGCDSIRRIVNLAVHASAVSITNAAICLGQNYTLPWGLVVNAAGVYKDTLRYTGSGCDSIRRTVNLAIQTAVSTTTNAAICSGQSYTLPWGVVVNTSGIYSDTLRYVAGGCDSVRQTINLSVNSSVATINNAVICAGQTYTLPWGTIVSNAGVYRDTLRYSVSGCDSVRRTINLAVQSPLAPIVINPAICSGQSYTLPWGLIVNSAGVYKDTLRYTGSGCDSIRRTVNLSVQTATATNSNVAICAGQNYTLPWGAVVNATGVYRDTLRYTVTGCDSTRRTVNLVVQSANTTAISVTICAGKTYNLPWGIAVGTAGVYKDTLHYRNTNCDSLIRIVNLTVTPAAITASSASICAGETYVLPWGVSVTNAGIYRDTQRTAFGCDSLVRTVTLSVKPAPSLSLTKSNDINCIIGIANLSASGGLNYLWWPASSLSDSTTSSPVASPNFTTTYHVRATNSAGCIKEDSIIVLVNKNDIANGFQLPTAFTPNGDGLNDCFGVRTWGNVTNLKLEIYDRWGRLIFVTTNPAQCWDGNDKAVQLVTGAFIYQVAADTNCGRVFRKGTVMLIR
ncbi:MAG: gliding motility-associated C-terminal domain-containing protein [Bacteroidota bacterium]